MAINPTQQDIKYLKRCFTLARKAGVKAYPNPMVGAVIVKSGRVIGEGYHRFCGADHAEVDAIKNCLEDPAGATIYINLEPCNHHGRTPPCTEAILKAGLSRVVCATNDHNPIASGGGAFLRLMGVEVISGILDKEARELNSAFFTSTLLSRPQITLKLAQTLNAKIARQDGSSRWITCPLARRDVHLERSRNQAIFVGKRTLMIDNPQLTVRDVKGVSPIPIVLDADGNLPVDLKVFKNSETLIFRSANTYQTSPNQIEWNGKLSREDQWNFMLNELRQRGIISLYVEGGRQIATFLLENELVDVLHLYLGPGAFESGSLDSFRLNRELSFRLLSSRKIGQTVKLVYKDIKVQKCLQD